MQTNEFRKATSFRSLAVGRSRSDNTFATARNLGTVRANTTRFSARASGSVGRSDKVDFYKLTFAPGVNLRENNTYRIRNGSITVSVYGEAQGKRAFAGRFAVRRGSTTVRGSSVINPTNIPLTVYLKVERRTGNARYNVGIDLFR